VTTTVVDDVGSRQLLQVQKRFEKSPNQQARKTVTVLVAVLFAALLSKVVDVTVPEPVIVETISDTSIDSDFYDDGCGACAREV